MDGLDIEADVSHTDIYASPRVFDGNNDFVKIGPQAYEEGHIFSNDLLLRKIFNLLSFQDLKSVRQLNRLCNLEATKILIKNFITKPIQISNTDVELRRDIEFEQNPKLSLEDFTQIIENSLQFPSSCFRLSLESKFSPESQEVYNFFEEHGHNVKSLHIFSDTITPKNLVTIEKILTELLPKLEILEVTGDMGMLFWNESKICNQQLKKLKTLIFQHCHISQIFLPRMLIVAKKMENIYVRVNGKRVDWNRPFSCRADLNLNEAQHLLRSAELCVQPFPFSLDFFENCLSSDNNKLRNVFEVTRLYFEEFPGRNIPTDWSRMGRMLTTFFQTNCQSLKSICRMFPLGHFPVDTLILPIFQNVAYLGLDCYSTNHLVPRPIFHPGVNMALTFPCLKSITLHVHPSSLNWNPRILFPGDQTPLVSVQNLKIAEDNGWEKRELELPTVWVKFLQQLLPNLIAADFGYLENFNTASVFLWRMERLEDLLFGLVVRNGDEPFPHFDSIFTGMSHESVERLHKTPPKELNKMTKGDVRALQVGRSLGDLQKLKKLRILFNDQRSKIEISAVVGVDPGDPGAGQKHRVEDNILLSHITGRFAFRMCPLLHSNVQVALFQTRRDNRMDPVKYDPQHAFRTLVPFVRPILIERGHYLVVDENLSYPLEDAC